MFTPAVSTVGVLFIDKIYMGIENRYFAVWVVGVPLHHA